MNTQTPTKQRPHKQKQETKLGGSSGLSADGVMGFLKELKAFSHSASEVRGPVCRRYVIDEMVCGSQCTPQPLFSVHKRTHKHARPH